MIIISKVITFMKHIKMFPNCVRYGSISHVINGLGSKSGYGFNKGFADINQRGRNSGFRSKVEVRL